MVRITTRHKVKNIILPSQHLIRVTGMIPADESESSLRVFNFLAPHRRQILVDGIKEMNIFYEKCLNCHLKLSMECLGGQTVVTKGACSYYSRRNMLTTLLVEKELEVSYFTVYPFYGGIYWSLFKQEEEEFLKMPYRLGNVHETHNVCTGSARFVAGNINESINNLFSAVWNADLMPNKFKSNPAAWVRQHSPEAQIYAFGSGRFDYNPWQKCTNEVIPPKTNEYFSSELEPDEIEKLVCLSVSSNRWTSEDLQRFPFLSNRGSYGTCAVGYVAKNGNVHFNHDQNILTSEEFATAFNSPTDYNNDY